VTASERATELATAAAMAAADKLATDVVALDVSDQLVITDVFLVASAPNDRQVRSIVDAVEERLLPMGAKPIRREGHREGRWVLLDFGDLVVHVQHAEEREYYSLERLWRDCPVIELPEEARGQRRYPLDDPEPGPISGPVSGPVSGLVSGPLGGPTAEGAALPLR
jgi:ribosome-associated protein